MFYSFVCLFARYDLFCFAFCSLIFLFITQGTVLRYTNTTHCLKGQKKFWEEVERGRGIVGVQKQNVFKKDIALSLTGISRIVEGSN